MSRNPLGGSTYIGIQYLRAVAALMVVAHHARNPADGAFFNPIENYPAFAWGVDIFFVISGFIMGIAAHGERPREFLIKRVIRIAPLYWIATAALLIVSLNVDLISMEAGERSYVYKSLLFIPDFRPGDGTLFPYLTPGWTLNFEMFFYLLFLIGLVVGRPFLITAIAIPILVIGGFTFSPVNAIGFTYTNPLLLEFLAGHIIAVLHRRGALPVHKSFMLSLPFGFVLLLAAPVADGEVQIVIRLLAASLIVLGAVVADPYTSVNSTWKLLGDASYSIYLVHTILLVGAARRLPSYAGLGGVWDLFLVIGGAIFLSTMVGVVVHILLERPMLRYFRNLLLPTPPVAIRNRTTH